MKKIERLQKYGKGGGIRKLYPGGTIREQEEEMLDEAFLNAQKLTNPAQRQKMLNEIRQQQELLHPTALQSTASYLPQTSVSADMSSLSFNNQTNQVEGNVAIEQTDVNPQEYFTKATTAGDNKPGGSNIKGNLGKNTGTSNVPWGMIGDAAIGLNNAVDDTVMGDKNFSASSKALDQGVDAAASMASKFGPWGLLAAGILKTLNSASKYGGQNVQGYDVNINNSGYGTMGHMESEAGRVWDKWSGATARKLAKRNEQARMALAAMDISEDTKYEQEARTNSVTNALQQNQIALAGGIDTSLLGS